MRTISLFMCALVVVGCADRGVSLKQPVGTTTAAVKNAPGEAVPAAPSSGVGEDATSPSEPADACADPTPVAFSGSSTLITEPQNEELVRLAKCLNTAPNDESTVVLIGYTDLMGTVPSNIELGLTRAQAVMKQLIASGVAPGRIVVASAGELQRPSARLGLHAPRVEIMFARGGPARPNEAPIARGIDAEGLIRRPPTTKTSSAPAPKPNRATNTPRR